MDDGVGAATVYRIFVDGCRETILPMFGPRLGFLVRDRATVLGFWAMALRQVCHAHLLRKYVAFHEREGPAGNIGRDVERLSGSCAGADGAKQGKEVLDFLVCTVTAHVHGAPLPRLPAAKRPPDQLADRAAVG